MSRAWMPLYVADYLADTGHLSAAEHGAYLLLIMHYWQNGGLPGEDRRLARIARMSQAEWDDSREVLADLFDEGWKHPRIEAELKAAQEISDKAKDKAEKRWGKTRGNAVADAAAHAVADAAALPQQSIGICQSQSQSPTPSEPKGSDGARAKARRPEHAQILECLMAVLSEDRAKAVIEHRRKKKAPLGLHAAKLLVEQFRQITEPDKAADLMILRGWQGCEPDWCAKAGLRLTPAAAAMSGQPERIFVKRDTDEWFARVAAGHKPGLSKFYPEHQAEGWLFPAQMHH